MILEDYDEHRWQGVNLNVLQKPHKLQNPDPPQQAVSLSIWHKQHYQGVGDGGEGEGEGGVEMHILTELRRAWPKHTQF